MIAGDVFVFDNVVHMYDYSDENLKSPESDYDRQCHLQKATDHALRRVEKFYAGYSFWSENPGAPLSGC